MYKNKYPLGNTQQSQQTIEIKPDEILKILNLKSENVEIFVRKAEECANSFKSISTNKIRNFYDYVKSIREYDKVKLHLLKPKIAYAIARAQGNDEKRAMKEFQKIIESLINNVNSPGEFENFVKFFEAIIAYHKIYNKK